MNLNTLTALAAAFHSGPPARDYSYQPPGTSGKAKRKKARKAQRKARRAQRGKP